MSCPENSGLNHGRTELSPAMILIGRHPIEHRGRKNSYQLRRILRCRSIPQMFVYYILGQGDHSEELLGRGGSSTENSNAGESTA